MIRLPGKKRRLLLGGSVFFIVLVLLVVWFVIPVPEFSGNYSLVVTDRDGNILRAFLNSDEQWHFPPVSNEFVPEQLKTAVVLFEDEKFYKHHGVDISAVFRAISQNIKSGGVVSGASTITMQVCRILKPKPRTVLNKAKEMIQSVKMETKFSKDQILMMYLNHAPYGGNIVGWQTALYAYWGKEKSQITWAEAALLAVLPNSPGLIRLDNNRQILKDKRDRLLTRLFNANFFDDSTYQLSLLEPLPRIHSFPFMQPHLSERIRTHVQNSGWVKTTIDMSIQRIVDVQINLHHTRLLAEGIPQMGVLIANTRTGEIVAYSGSPDYYGDFESSQIDAVWSPHLTGSILKPFLYALAMDDGILLPDTMIEDLSTAYGSFIPAR